MAGQVFPSWQWGNMGGEIQHFAQDAQPGNGGKETWMGLFCDLGFEAVLHSLLLSNKKSMSIWRHCNWELAKGDDKMQRTHQAKGLTVSSERPFLSSLVFDQNSLLEKGFTAVSLWQCVGAGCGKATGSGLLGCFIWMTKGNDTQSYNIKKNPVFRLTSQMGALQRWDCLSN